MDCLKNLQLGENEIRANLRKNNYSEDEANLILKNLNAVIVELKSARNDEELTDEVILSIPDKLFKDIVEILNIPLDPLAPSDYLERMAHTIHHWLIKLIQDDYSYSRAYNILAQTINCYFPLNPPYKPRKIILSKLWESMEMELSKNSKYSLLQQQTEETTAPPPAKYYALYHWLLIEMGIEKNFERDLNDNYKKKEIEAFAIERYPNTSSQGFYRWFIQIDITKKAVLARDFGKGYKDKLIAISNKDAKIIIHLKNYPN